MEVNWAVRFTESPIEPAFPLVVHAALEALYASETYEDRLFAACMYEAAGVPCQVIYRMNPETLAVLAHGCANAIQSLRLDLAAITRDVARGF